MFRFNTRSSTEQVRRYIQKRKFYATLPSKLDRAEEEWLNAQLIPEDPWESEETGTFGEDGWSISYSHKSVQKKEKH